jgi:hypothetical protein
MATANTEEPETLLADLELTRGLAIQMTALGTLGVIVDADGDRDERRSRRARYRCGDRAGIRTRSELSARQFAGR